MVEINLVSPTPDTTRAIGETMGRYLKGGEIICLYGELGVGKTCLTQGIAQGLKVEDPRRVKSPSFILIREYNGSLPLYHIDLFRLSTPQEMEELGYEEYLYGEGVTVIEWADKMGQYLPRKRIDIFLSYREEGKREIRINWPDLPEPLWAGELSIISREALVVRSEE
ncbi:MAG: tRNA (adenosine(37)-N6)-threonylcarbamoyltransferase complex ATPase subunit type 1 TsaE [Nitrospinae bacterium RIFCSPLOWO2_12_FULL_45_22]|nr:MAG: tRNA (adenosine(37)-N6)-threonylcarbamoyltransferase complex ATPase subunit type 1 TsaE [Nitrospinae bacterium RIFCSPLOWO2_12_FULL_45_22]